MRTRNRSLVAFAGAGAFAILLAAAPGFAAPFASAQQDRDDRYRGDMRRDNERIEHQGHVRSFTRERDGYRIYVDNDERSYWVPADRINRPLSVGLSINLGGVFRGGLVNVDAVTWPDDRDVIARAGGIEFRRDNDRIERQGRVRSFTRERDGYRIYLDNDDRSFWVPADRLNRPLRVGLALNLGGVFRGGVIYADAVTWPEESGYVGRPDHFELRGVVDRIDYRSRTIWLRHDGRMIRVDMRDRDLLRGLSRGDRVTLDGRWTGDGDFAAFRIDQVR